MKILIGLIFILSTFRCWGQSLPKIIPGVRVVTVKEVKQLLANSKFQFIDVRSLLEYSEGHIPGAVNIPLKHNRLELVKLKAITSPNIIIYCNGVECSKSHRAINFVLHQKLDKKILWFRTGLADWYAHFLWVRKGIMP